MHEAEVIERAELVDIHAAATPRERETLGLQLTETGGALLSIVSNLPVSAIVINRALGSESIDRPTLQQIVNTYRAVGAQRYFVQLTPEAQTADTLVSLQELGLERSRGWQKFVRDRAPAPAIKSDLQIREIGPEHGQDFARIACAAFDLGDAAIPWLSNLPGRPNWHFFMSFDGEKPAGVGGLFVHNKIAWMDFGATAPEFRRRGGQSAVLSARIAKALALGCERMYTCTGVAVPGDPQHSYSNILRAGFRTDYVRDNFEPASTD